MPFVKIYVHAVWGTKDRFPFLKSGVRSVMLDHIHSNAKKKSIYIDRLNGVSDHLHCLFLLNANMTLANAIQLIKGESSFWFNRQKLIKEYFEWADEYYAVSISDSDLRYVRNYIDDQENHHRKKTFAEECDELLLKHGFVMGK